jgi:hypothetical protein
MRAVLRQRSARKTNKEKYVAVATVLSFLFFFASFSALNSCRHCLIIAVFLSGPRIAQLYIEKKKTNWDRSRPEN